MCINVSPAPFPLIEAPPPLHTHPYDNNTNNDEVFLSLQCLSPTLILPLKPPPLSKVPPLSEAPPLSPQKDIQKKNTVDNTSVTQMLTTPLF